MSDTFDTILFSSIGLTTAGVAGAGLDGILLEVEQRRGSLAGHGLHCIAWMSHASYSNKII